MLIKDILLGKKLEILVDREGYHYRFVSKVEGVAGNSVAVTVIAAKGRMFHFEEADNVSIVYRSSERMWKWDHVKAGLARLEGSTVHTFSSKEQGQIYNRREAFRVPIGESLLMRRIVTKRAEPVNSSAEKTNAEAEVTFDALLADLSVGGAGLYANEDMEVGTVIVFEMPTNLGILACRGEIVRRSEVYDKPFRHFYGCEFTVVKKELERYLFERQRLMLQRERGGESVRLKDR